MSTGIFLTNGQWRTYPQGYQYGDNFYCPDHILEQLPSYQGVGVQTYAQQVPRESVEELLVMVGNNHGIDYSDEYSYDSDVFPKAVTDQTEPGDKCAVCNTDLTEVE